MIRAHASSRESGTVRVLLERYPPCRRLLAYLAIGAVQLFLLATTAACSAPTLAGGGNPVPSVPAATSVPAVPAATSVPAVPAATSNPAVPAAVPGVQPTLDPATLDAKSRLEAAVAGAVAAGTKPGTEQSGTEQSGTEVIRAAVAAAGFPSDGVEITAGRTPTGLATDAVEVAVQAGRNCVVAQLRGGSVAASVLPPLATGRCLVGTLGTR
ncbi:hypothetical protein BJG92_00347 [Arthrobacter sp. SO5]|uniref:DUF6993 domain-containing protein n=1 Tax=Arthrobacter sp. SO5 TaxID=1897055 RepID=UPI001E5F352D|nr:hypothetical protein [Arthrobacter sp. SO5]MCB5272840.1 hypothetical protein [Arthrobacter sp. SO5]